MALTSSQYKSFSSFYNTLPVHTNSSQFEEHCNSTQENDLEELVDKHSHRRAKLSKETFFHGRQQQPTDIISAIGNNFLIAKSLVQFSVEPEQNIPLLL